MVSSLRFLILLQILIWAPFAQAQEISMTAEIEKGNHIEYQPLKGLIAIMHDKNDKVDEKSFRLQDKPLSVEPLQEVAISPSSPIVISFYRFELQGQTRGLHELPAISAKVGQKTLTSVPTTYEVGVLAVGEAASKVVLQFENIVKGDQTLFPGERIKLGYRYTYSGSIDLTEETLPLLDATGFLKIGAKSIKDFKKGTLNIREITQEVEASKPGTYTLGPSSVVGYAYKMDDYGKRQYLKPQLQSGAPAVTITVNPFPEKDKPPSFNGAIGPYDHFTVHLLSSPKINVGDKIVLAVEIGGKGQLANVPLPALCCQPGFSGQFALSDLPPSEQSKGPSAKEFTVEMRVLSASITQIPPVEFAYFDPASHAYKVLRSQPIPISVAALSPPPASSTAAPAVPEKKVDTTASHGEVAHNLAPIEIQGIKPLNLSDLRNPILGSWSVILSLPLALLGLLLQLNSYKAMQREGTIVKPKTSQDFMKEAQQALRDNPKGSPEYFNRLKAALLLRLKEKGHTLTLNTNPETLPEEGVSGKVREFLVRIEEKRFTGQEQDIDQSIQKEAESLFKDI